MAPATTIASSATPTSTLHPQRTDFNGDEFSNNLFSDLAPLLTLFGEQVTKQFLTMSMGWADNVLVAMGPLGILTLVVSAIRVGGVRRLKGLVGRARESQATAEQELLSSTSSSVCELWSGKEIVRQLGQPDTKELIVVAYEGKFVQVLDLEGAVRGGWLHENVGPDQRATLPELRTIDSQAPNIALNIEGSTATKNELWMWAGIGVLLQSVALVVPALATYYWKFRKASASVPRYAYPCFLIGASVVTIGALLCSHVIEGITEERIFEPSGDSDHPPGEILYVVRLQKACTVSDQSFRPFLIYNQLGNKSIRTSRMKTTEDPQFSKLAAFSSLLTVAGFICQFVGLRGLHWSATILQLGVTLIMTAARSWVRRGLAVNPPCIELTPGNELIWASILLSQGILPINGGQKDVSGLLAHTTTSDLKTTSALVRSQIWEFMTGGFHKNYPGFDLHDPEQENKPLVSWPPKPQEPIDATLYPGDQLLEILSHLQQIMPEQNTLLRITSNISRAMEQTISLLNRHVFDRVLTNTGLWEEFTWRHWILHNELQHETAPSLSQISFSIFYETDGRVQIPREKMYSAIRLWMASLETRPEFSNKIEHSSDARHSFTYMRFLGPCRDYSKATFEALPRWIGKKIILCPKPDGRKGFLTNNEVDYLHAQAWPVFGTSVVSGEDNIAEKHHLKPPSFVQQVSDGFMHADTSEEDVEECIGIISHNSTATQCALELFSGFMDTVASQVGSIGGVSRTEWTEQDDQRSHKPSRKRTPEELLGDLQSSVAASDEEESDASRSIASSSQRVRTDGPSSLYNGARWTNTVLHSLSQVLVDTGVVTSIEEANAVVIPPFARRGLLPKRLGTVRFDPVETGQGDAPTEDAASVLTGATSGDTPISVVEPDISEYDLNRRRRRAERARAQQEREQFSRVEFS